MDLHPESDRLIFTKAGVKAITVTLELDKAEIAIRRVTQGGRFRMEANVPARAPAELVVRCGPLHSPHAAGLGSADKRELCVIIDTVTLRKRELRERQGELGDAGGHGQ